ncbi:MAG TPA: hypothetical protein VGO52_06675 [Hyphomonadaceae bacterium]|jgi:hypothetical protein|nr:hypothetical protein [Hyphomonadaceae bacterium]
MAQDTDFAQRFQHRSRLKVSMLLLPRVLSRTSFPMGFLTPFFVAAQQIRTGFDPAGLWWLAAAPACWLLGHVLWRVADADAFSINRSEARRDDRGFFLLLRPFKASAATAVPGAPETPGVIGHLFPAPHAIIWQYGVQLASWGRLVTVGRVRLPKPILTNDTVSVRAKDHNWMVIVRDLAERSRAIIVLFDEGRGILEEMKHLSSSGLTDKTIIRVAPVQPQVSDPQASQKRWNEARRLLQGAGLNPPEATPEGFLYIPNPDFSIKHSAPLPQGTEAALAQLLAQIAPGKRDSSLKDAMRAVDAFERQTFRGKRKRREQALPGGA